MLYIIRHGQTDWNLNKRLQGSTDIPLNENGRQMAIDARSQLAGIHFDVCYSSPLIRAYETAQLLLQNADTPIHTDNRLCEMSFGDFEGIYDTYDNPDFEINVLFNTPGKYKAVNGSESLESLYKRTGHFLKEVIYPALEEGKNILIVGHGAMNCSIINQIKDIPVDEFWKEMTGNCVLKQLI